MDSIPLILRGDIGVDIANSQCGDSVMLVIAKAMAGSSVQSFCAENTDISDEGIKSIVNFGLTTSSINYLVLSNNRFGNEGFNALVKILPLTKVARLFVEYNDLDDESIISLAQAIPASRLIQLGLDGTSFTDVGMRALIEAVKQSRTMKLISVSHNSKLSPALKRELESALADTSRFAVVKPVDELSLLRLENAKLKAENEALKREVVMMKRRESKSDGE